MYTRGSDPDAMLKVRLAAGTLIAIACLSMASCGSSKKQTVVVRVGNNTISAATVDHWIRVESVTAHGGSSATPQPSGVLPVPPEYTDCITYLISQAPAGSKPTREEARVKCAAQYEIFKETVIDILVSYYWALGEGAAKGINVSDAEVAAYLKQAYPHPGEFSRHLVITHETSADDRMLVRKKLMTEKLVSLSAKNTHSATERVRAISKQISEETAKWMPRTSCNPGYVIYRCKQYRAPRAQ